MGRRRITLSLAQRRVIRQQFIDKGIAQKQTREALKTIPRCYHGEIKTICQLCRKEKETDIPF